MMRLLQPIFASLALYLIADAVFLTLTKRFYRAEMGALLRAKINWPPALAFYLVYAIAITMLAVLPNLRASLGPAQLGIAAVQGAFADGLMLGLAAYATYNCTNLAVIKEFPARLAAIDLVWGTLATGVTAAAVTAFMLR